MNTNCILAMYDFRGKQKYIYRTNRIKEIVGASSIIADGFNELYRIAENNGVRIEHDDENPDFSSDNLFGGGEYQGKVVYEGGGNLFVLYDSKESYLKVNRAFTKHLLENTYSLRIICADIEVDMSKGDRDFEEDRTKLYERHAYLENKELLSERANVLPVVQVDRATALPLCDIVKKGGKPEKVSLDSKAKLEKYSESGLMSGMKYSNQLDDYVTERNEESLLAVVYIDGNKIGERVRKLLDNKDGKIGYSEGVSALRQFSNRINNLCIVDGMDAIYRKCKEISNDHKESPSEKEQTKYYFRPIVAAGDEVTFICNARLAYPLALEYLNAIHKSGYQFEESEDGEMTSCAGISVFHSHAPFADAYRIAEECCEEAKRKSHKYPGTSWLSFQFCQSGIDNSLNLIREKEDGELVSRPWLVIDTKGAAAADSEVISIEQVEALAGKLNRNSVSRSNTKSLLQYAADINGASYLKQELRRIIAHSSSPDIKNDYFNIDGVSEDLQKKLFYDVVLMYDLWFREDN